MRDDSQLRSSLASHTALGHVGRPDDIAYVASNELRWVAAERIEIADGYWRLLVR